MNRVRQRDVITITSDGIIRCNAHLAKKLKGYNAVSYEYRGGYIYIKCFEEGGDYKITRRNGYGNAITMGAKAFLAEIGWTTGVIKQFDAEYADGVIKFNI